MREKRSTKIGSIISYLKDQRLPHVIVERVGSYSTRLDLAWHIDDGLARSLFAPRHLLSHCS